METFLRSVASRLPVFLAWRFGTFVASVSVRRKLSDQDRSLLSIARRFAFGPDQSRVAYAFGKGPLVILVHGWSGRGAQLAFLAHQIAAQGFRAVVFDASAHGESKGRLIGFDRISRDLKGLIVELGEPVHALIGHSAGGMVAMAGRKTLGIVAERYVCLSAPYFPYPPIDALRSRLGLSKAALERCKSYYAGQFDRDWRTLEDGDAYRNHGQGSVFLVYDKDDDQIRYSDAALIKRDWPNAGLLSTSTLGHARGLKDATVVSRIARFVRTGA